MPSDGLVGERVAILFKAMASILNPLLYTSASPELRLVSRQARKRFSLPSSFRKLSQPLRRVSKRDVDRGELRELRKEIDDLAV